MCNRSDLIIALNNQSRNYLAKKTNTSIRVIPNFIEESEIDNSRIINQTISKVLYVGGVVEDKGVLDFIQVAKAFPDIEFRIVGDGDDSIKEFAKENHIDNVVFTGPQKREDVKKELLDADVFLFLTYFYGEGFSNALCEAMAAGLPCIVTDWAANKDMIGEKGGIVVGVKDVESAIKALNVMKDRDVRCKMSEANIQKVRTSYTDCVVLNQYVDAYESLLN